MLLRAEFEANMSFLEPSIESMLAAGEGEFLSSRWSILAHSLLSELMSNQKLQDLFLMVLMAGNFLNSVSEFKFFLRCGAFARTHVVRNQYLTRAVGGRGEEVVAELGS